MCIWAIYKKLGVIKLKEHQMTKFHQKWWDKMVYFNNPAFFSFAWSLIF